jgi:hypothetical protein
MAAQTIHQLASDGNSFKTMSQGAYQQPDYSAKPGMLAKLQRKRLALDSVWPSPFAITSRAERASAYLDDIIFRALGDGVEISERVLALWLPRQDLQSWTRPKAPSS